MSTTDHEQQNQPQGQDEPNPAQEPQGSQDTHAGREAAKYRTRLRETEAERDTLRERLTAMQTAEAERLAGAAGITPAALWATTKLDDILDADAGIVDAERVTAAAQQAQQDLGIQPTPTAPPAFGQGRAGSSISSGDGRPAWEQAFAPQQP